MITVQLYGYMDLDSKMNVRDCNQKISFKTILHATYTFQYLNHLLENLHFLLEEKKKCLFDFFG